MISASGPIPVHRIGGYAAFRPPPDLRRLVDRVWVHAGAVGDGTVVVPDPGLSLCLRCRRAADGRVVEGELLLIGPVRTPRRYAPPPGSRLEGIHLPPEWSRPLLGVAPWEAEDAVVDFAHVCPDAAGRLREALGRTRSTSEAIRVLLDRVRARLGSWCPDGAAVLSHHALERIRRHPLPAALRPVAEDMGVSDRHLRRVVREVTGLTPRAHARASRLLRVVRAADATPRPSWVDLAAAHGFADQAHLSREMQSLAGMPPTRLHRTRRSETVTGR